MPREIGRRMEMSCKPRALWPKGPTVKAVPLDWFQVIVVHLQVM